MRLSLSPEAAWVAQDLDLRGVISEKGNVSYRGGHDKVMRFGVWCIAFVTLVPTVPLLCLCTAQPNVKVLQLQWFVNTYVRCASMRENYMRTYVYTFCVPPCELAVMTNSIARKRDTVSKTKFTRSRNPGVWDPWSWGSIVPERRS